jgi:hypothetical protein
MKRVPNLQHFEHFSIAGFTYNEGAMVFNDLTIGTELQLVAEPENRFDKNAVAIYYGDKKLGFIPRSNNREISKDLNAGYNVFKAIIQRISPTVVPEDQIGVIVFIVKNVEN